jgi:hypothetical protein
MDDVTPTKGKNTLNICTGIKKDVAFGGTLEGLDPGDLSLPHGRWPLKAQDVTIMTLYVIYS